MAVWKPTNEDFRRVVDEQNPWLLSGKIPVALAPPTKRPLAKLLPEVIIVDQPHRFQIVLGPRRVGKTTAMYQTVGQLLDQGVPRDSIWWLRLDHPFYMRVALGDLVGGLVDSAVTTEKPLYLFLDELMYAEDWDLWLKTFYDDRLPVKIIATSSATAALKKARTESGVGRWEEQYLAPYLLTEFMQLSGEHTELPTASSLQETIEQTPSGAVDAMRGVCRLRRTLLLQGGFPELLTRESERDEETLLLESQRVLRSDAVERAIYKDIPQSFGVDNPMMLERLVYVLAGQVTGILSPTKICQELDGLSQPTFDRYVSYLERAFLVFALPNFSGREASVQRRGRKLYFVDSAVRNAALQRGISPLNDPAEMGVLLENMAAGHLHALSQHSQVRLYHWRDGDKEVDLVYDHPTNPVAFEIASSPNHSRAGLAALIERHNRFRGRAYLVAPAARFEAASRASSGIGSLGLDHFLVAVGSQAAAAMRARLI